MSHKHSDKNPDYDLDFTNESISSILALPKGTRLDNFIKIIFD